MCLLINFCRITHNCCLAKPSSLSPPMDGMELLFFELKQRLYDATSHIKMEEKLHYVVSCEWARVRKLKFMIANEITLRI